MPKIKSKGVRQTSNIRLCTPRINHRDVHSSEQILPSCLYHPPTCHVIVSALVQLLVCWSVICWYWTAHYPCHAGARWVTGHEWLLTFDLCWSVQKKKLTDCFCWLLKCIRLPSSCLARATLSKSKLYHQLNKLFCKVHVLLVFFLKYICGKKS